MRLSHVFGYCLAFVLVGLIATGIVVRLVIAAGIVVRLVIVAAIVAVRIGIGVRDRGWD